MIKGKTPEEIRKLFNIVNDFTPEEEVRRVSSFLDSPPPDPISFHLHQAQIKKENVSPLVVSRMQIDPDISLPQGMG